MFNFFFFFFFMCTEMLSFSFLYGSDGKKNSAYDAEDLGFIPESERSPGEGNSNPLQYSCLENSSDRGAWWATVYGVAELDTTEQLTLPTSAFMSILIIILPWTLKVKVIQSCPTLSLGLSGQEYWSGLPFSSLADHPDPGIEPTSLASLALARM